MRRTRISTLFTVVASAILAAVWLLPITLNPSGIPFWRNALFSDLLISHWPNAIFLRRSILLWKQIPMWNPTILSGYPFLADPLSGVWYPPLWFAAVFPSPVTFNLLFWLHLVWAAVGMWQLAQSEGLSDFAALLSGVIFAGAPKWSAHIGLGHIGLVSAVSWTPWLLLATRHAIQSVSLGRESAFRLLCINGLTLGVVFLADPRWLLPSLLLMVLYAMYVLNKLSLEFRTQTAVAIRWAGISGLFALGVVAGFASSLVRFVTNSTRTLLDSSVPDPFALEWREFSGILLLEPDQPEKYIYIGLGAAFFAVVGILMGRRRGWFWYVAALLGLLISLGANLPVLGPQLQSIPAASLLRVPPRWFFLVILAVAYFAGSGFEALIQAPIRGREYGRSIILISLVAGGVYLLAATRGGEALNRALPLLVPAAALVPLILFRRSGWLHPLTFMLASLVILTIEFSVVNLFVLETRPAPEVNLEQGSALSSRAEPYGQGRWFSPSFSVDPFTAGQEGLELADGVHPLQLDLYWIYMSRAIGFERDQYSVTLPPFPTGDPRERWPMELDVDALSRLNIHTIVSAYPLQANGLTLISSEPERFVYEVDRGRPRAWVEGGGDHLGAWQPAQLSYWSPNRIELVASGPGRLVLSEVAYPGWVAHVDGEPTASVIADGLFRGVQLDEGDHRVQFVYRPTHLFVGSGLTLLTLLAAFYLQVRR